MSKYLTFRCKCGDTELEEIMVNVMCTSTFQRVEVKGDAMERIHLSGQITKITPTTTDRCPGISAVVVVWS